MSFLLNVMLILVFQMINFRFFSVIIRQRQYNIPCFSKEILLTLRNYTIISYYIIIHYNVDYCCFYENTIFRHNEYTCFYTSMPFLFWYSSVFIIAAVQEELFLKIFWKDIFYRRTKYKIKRTKDAEILHAICICLIL